MTFTDRGLEEQETFLRTCGMVLSWESRVNLIKVTPGHDTIIESRIKGADSIYITLAVKNPRIRLNK